ncbi:MAG: NAD(P)-dependent oxidoreductase [Ktedonobacterales bacterium]
MRLVVTGANGFLGRNALLTLPRDWQIVALHRPQDAALPAFLARHRLDHITPVSCDLTDAAQVATAAQHAAHGLGSDPWDACLYLASNTDIPRSIAHPAFDLTTNTIGLINTLENWQFDHLVYLSSGAVYIGLNGIVGVETPVTPTLPYAIAKLASEQYVRAFARHRGNPRRATIVRFFGAFGPYEPSRKLYTKLARQFAFARNPAFTITGDGDNYIDAMYVDDAVQALRLVLDAPPEQPGVSESAESVRLVNLGMGARETVNEIARRAACVFDIVPQITHTGASPEYITFAIDPAHFAAQYGFAPSVTLEDGFQRLAAHLRQEDDYGAG